MRGWKLKERPNDFPRSQEVIGKKRTTTFLTPSNALNSVFLFSSFPSIGNFILYSIWPSWDEDYYFLILIVSFPSLNLFLPTPDPLLEQDCGNKQYVETVRLSFYCWILLCRHIRLDEKSCYFINISTKSQFEGKVFIPLLLLFAMWLWEKLGNEDLFFLSTSQGAFKANKNDDSISKTGHVIMEHLRAQRENWKRLCQVILKSKD